MLLDVLWKSFIMYYRMTNTYIRNNVYTHDPPCMDVVQGWNNLNYPHDTRKPSAKNTIVSVCKM